MMYFIHIVFWEPALATAVHIVVSLTCTANPVQPSAQINSIKTIRAIQPAATAAVATPQT